MITDPLRERLEQWLANHSCDPNISVKLDEYAMCPIHRKEKIFCRICVEKMVEAG